MYVLPKRQANEKNLPKEYIYNILLYILPQVFQVLPRHIDLQIAMSAQIRNRYVGFMPFTPDFIKKARINNIKDLIAEPTTNSFALIGPSGTGKSRILKIILLNYPQVIYHSIYKGRVIPFTQLVWLKVDCPSRASLKTLGLNILGTMDAILGTDYRHKAIKGDLSADDIVNEVGNKCHIHGVGVLVIDEIQRLNNATDGPQQMLDFFVSMMDKIGTPMILVGTPSATGIFTNAFANARRNSGFGDFLWGRLSDDDHWSELIDTLFEYQWTKKEASANDFTSLFYQIAQGIPDVAVKLYAMCQWKAIERGMDVLTKDLVEELSITGLRLVAPMLNALRNNDYAALSQWSDLCMSWMNVQNIMRSESTDGRITCDGNSVRVQEVIIWLREAGVPAADAEKAVKEAVSDWGDADLEKIRRYAYEKATRMTSRSQRHNKTQGKANGSKDSAATDVLSYIIK